jgi:hypothetical protein
MTIIQPTSSNPSQHPPTFSTLQRPLESRDHAPAPRACSPSPSSRGGLRRTMRWGPPAQPSQLPEADPRRDPLLGGRGWGRETTTLSDLRLAQAMARLRGGCARVRAIHPSSSSRVSRLEEPGHESWAGEDWAPPGGSRVRVRLEAPHGLLLARPRQEPMPRCDSESNDVADGIEGHGVHGCERLRGAR